MKKYNFLSLFMLALPVMCCSFFSFSSNAGGDVFEIYLNGKQVLRQVVHIDESVKTLQLNASGDNDKIEVFYSHCGNVGKNRVLTLRNEKNELIKVLKFANVYNERSMMGFYLKDIANKKEIKLNLYYSAKELPEEKLLATILLKERKLIAKL